MIRFTEKIHDLSYDTIENVGIDFAYDAMITKLGQLEDIEEKHNIKSVEDLDKRLTTLKIIKEKDVSPIDIRCCDTVEQYNVKENGNTPLTQEEYDLLKEYFNEKN